MKKTVVRHLNGDEWENWFSDSYFEKLITDNVMVGLQKGEYLLIFVWGDESFFEKSPFEPENLKLLEDKLDKYKIPHENFMWMDANWQNKSNLKKINSKIQVKTFHNLISATGSLPSTRISFVGLQKMYSSDPQQEFWKWIEDSYERTKDKKRNKHFLSTNKTIHNHRLILALLFEKFNLFEKSYVTFPPKNSNWEMELGRDGILQELTSKYNITKNDILSFESKLPLGTEEYETDKSIFYGKERSYMDALTNVNSPIWDTYFQLVTLTNFRSNYLDDGSDFNITMYVDKLWKIVATFQPFIIIGTPYSLETLRERGFKTFGKWIDESYDYIEDPVKRFNKIFQEILKLSNLSINEIHEMYIDMKDVYEYNYKHYKEVFMPRTILDKINLFNDSCVNYTTHNG
jgi:hypothetical protein